MTMATTPMRDSQLPGSFCSQSPFPSSVREGSSSPGGPCRTPADTRASHARRRRLDQPRMVLQPQLRQRCPITQRRFVTHLQLSPAVTHGPSARCLTPSVCKDRTSAASRQQPPNDCHCRTSRSPHRQNRGGGTASAVTPHSPSASPARLATRPCHFRAAPAPFSGRSMMNPLMTSA